MCNKGEIETLSHFVIECDYLRDIRDRFDIDGEVGMERILMFDQGGRDYVQKYKTYLSEIWKRRRVFMMDVNE